MLQKLNKEQEGFTIIEVLIVLAIAGLIMLIVFLAVPALQRNARNTSRKNDAGRIGTALNNFVTNNNATFPANTTDCGTVQTDAGSLSQYQGLTCAAPATISASTSGDFNIVTTSGDTSLPPTTTKNTIIFVPGVVCPTNSSTQTQVTTTGATNRTGVLLYSVEPGGGGNWIYDCQEVQ